MVLSLSAWELNLFIKHIQSCADIDAEVEKLVKWIKKAVAQHVPLSKPAPFSVPWWVSELTQLVRNARRARREHRRWPSADAWRAYLEELSAKGAAIRKAKAVHFKLALAYAAGKRREYGHWLNGQKHKATSLPPPQLSPILSHHLV